MSPLPLVISYARVHQRVALTAYGIRMLVSANVYHHIARTAGVIVFCPLAVAVETSGQTAQRVWIALGGLIQTQRIVLLGTRSLLEFGPSTPEKPCAVK